MDNETTFQVDDTPAYDDHSVGWDEQLDRVVQEAVDCGFIPPEPAVPAKTYNLQCTGSAEHTQHVTAADPEDEPDLLSNPEAELCLATDALNTSLAYPSATQSAPM